MRQEIMSQRYAGAAHRSSGFRSGTDAASAQRHRGRAGSEVVVVIVPAVVVPTPESAGEHEREQGTDTGQSEQPPQHEAMLTPPRHTTLDDLG
jgi:hypothetical protein